MKNKAHPNSARRRPQDQALVLKILKCMFAERKKKIKKGKRDGMGMEGRRGLCVESAANHHHFATTKKM